MNSDHIKNIMRAWQDVVEKKNLDPVGKADADIDNDGDVDKSDEYLHNRRKAIKKAMKNESEDEMKPCPKCDGSTENHDPDCPMADNGKEKEESSCGDKRMKKESVEQIDELSKDTLKSYLSKSQSKSGETVANINDPKSMKKYGNRVIGGVRASDKIRKMNKESVAHEKWGYGEVIEESENGYNVYFEHGVEFDVPVDELTILEKNYAERTKGATKPETMKDKLKGKGAQDMAKDVDMDNPELAADDAKGHEDATKAGRAVKSQSPTRGGEKRMGDKNIVNPVKGAVTSTTGKEG